MNQILITAKKKPTVIRRILIVKIICLISFISLYGQTTSESNKMFQRSFAKKSKLEPFYYFDNKIKKGNTHCFEILENDLVADVPIPADVLCRNNYGIFAFKINSRGKIEKLEYEGDLDSSIVRKIKLNIRKTEGNYTRPSKSNQESFHWFVLPFFSNGGMLNNQTCPNTEALLSEHHTMLKLFFLTQNLRKILPEFKSITIFHSIGHFSEMSKKGMLKHDTM
jgi:hypothetical protein